MKKKTRESSAARSVKGLPVKTIAAKTAEGVKAGRSRRGGDKLKYMEVKMEQVIIS